MSDGSARRPPHVTAGEATGDGIDHVHPAAAEGVDVLLEPRVLPHLGVHRRRHEHGSTGGEERRGEQVVGDAVRTCRAIAAVAGATIDQVGPLAEVGCAGSARGPVPPTPSWLLKRLVRAGSDARAEKVSGADEPERAGGEDGRHERSPAPTRRRQTSTAL